MNKIKKGSARERYKGMSFAEASKKISDKYKDRDTNPISQRSFLAEIEDLVKLQDVLNAKRASVDTIQEYRAPKYQWGGNLFPLLNLPFQTLKPKLGIKSADDPLSFGNDVTLTNGVSSSVGTLPPPGIQPAQRGVFNPPTNVFRTLMMYKGKGGMSFNPPNVPGVKESIAEKYKFGAPRLGVTDGSSFGAKGAGNDSNILTPLLIGKSAELLGKGLMALSGYDKVQPEHNPYESQIRREAEEMKIDMTPIRQRIMGEVSRARNMASGIRSEAVRQALYQNSQSEAMGKLSEAEMSAQDMNNRYRQARASILDTLGREHVQANQYAEQLTTQGKLTHQMGLQSLLESVGNVGKGITDYKANIAQQSILASALRTANFKFGNVSQILEKAYRNGEITEDDFIRIANSSGTADAMLKDVEVAKKKMAEVSKTKTKQ